MTYITSDALKASLDLTGETYADDDIAVAIAAASEMIDSTTHRRFTLDTNTNIRYYSPASHRLVDIDDVVTVQEVATGPGDGTFPNVLAVDIDYELAPYNAAADSRPYETLRIFGYRLYHRHHRRTVRVTGQFGWPAVPAAVVAATTLQAGRNLRRMREAPFGIVTIGLDGQPARIAQTDPDIAKMLSSVTRNLVA